MSRIRSAPQTPHDGRLLHQEATSLPRLREGWERVRDNGGAAGGDRVSCEAFGIAVDQRLENLRQDLMYGGYHPGPLRHVGIPKNSGGVRRLSIPCIRDRIVQTSVAMTPTPLFEQEFEDVSYGYRPGRSVKQALLKVQSLRDDGWRFTGRRQPIATTDGIYACVGDSDAVISGHTLGNLHRSEMIPSCEGAGRFQQISAGF